MPTLPEPHLRLAHIEWATTVTDPDTRRTVPLDQPAIRLRLFTVKGDTARYAHLTERELLGLVEDATRVLIRLANDREHQ